MKILYEDKFLIVVYKPSGLLSQGDKEESLENIVTLHTKAPVYIMTRLDKPVCGLVLFAKDKKTASLLTEMIQAHKITKIYHALVCGKVKTKGTIESYLMKNARLNITKVVNKGNIGAKYALLEYTLLEEKESNSQTISKVEINLKTGRHHQIRVQFASINAPLYGDTKYNKEFKHSRGTAPALCACKLQFIHPITKEEINIEIEDNLKIQ